MPRIALYCRVSTDTQEKAETIGNQLRDLYKIYNKKDIVKVYEDNPGSGADPDRTGLNELRRDAQRKLFDVVGVWASDRLARDVKLSLILRDEFRDLGIGIEVMGKPGDDSDSGKFLSTIEAAVDEMERSRIKRRFNAGKNRLLSEGKLIGCYPSYGYNYIRKNREKGIDSHFEINQREARIVKKIFKWYLELESMFLVTKRLVKKGIKTRGKNTEPKFFSVSTVKKILVNESYIGNHYFGKTSPCIAKYHIHKTWKHRFTGRRRNPRAEWRLVKVPAILDRDIFGKAQEIIKKRAKYKLFKSKYEFLCQGLIRCVRCGRSYGGRKQGEYLIYRCAQAYVSNFNEPVCRARSIVSHRLDNIVWAYVSSLINNQEGLKKNAILMRERREKGKVSSQKVYNDLLVEKNDLKIKKGKLLELYSDDSISKEDLKIKLDEFSDREKILDNQIVEISEELRGINSINATEEEVERICTHYKEKINNPSFELKKYIVRKWVEEVNIKDDGSIMIKVRIPEGEVKESFVPSYPLTTYSAQRR